MKGKNQRKSYVKGAAAKQLIAKLRHGTIANNTTIQPTNNILQQQHKQHTQPYLFEGVKRKTILDVL